MSSSSGGEPLKLGVTFHSFTHEFVSYVWSFEDLMINATQLGGGVEIVGPVHHRNFPFVPPEFVTAFRSSVERHGLTPTSYGNYGDPFMFWDRSLTAEELVEYTIPQIEGAAKLGFPIVRIQHFIAEIVEQVLPLAERLNVKLGYELHAPLTLESERTIELIEQIRRLQSPHLGLIPDGSIFARTISASTQAAGLDADLSEADRDAIVDLWNNDRPYEEAEDLLERIGAGGEAEEWAHLVWGTAGRSDPAALRELFDLVIHVHAKFYAMVDGEDPNIRYREVVNELVAGGYQGWISSEYEGPPENSFEMVVAQQRMIRRYEREYRAAAS